MKAKCIPTGYQRKEGCHREEMANSNPLVVLDGESDFEAASGFRGRADCI